MKKHISSLIGAAILAAVITTIGTTSAEAAIWPFNKRYVYVPVPEPATNTAQTTVANATQPTGAATGVVNVPSPSAQLVGATNLAAASRPVVVQFSTNVNGFTGGTECLFQNTRDRAVTVTVATTVNTEVYKYTFDIPSKDEEEAVLLPGAYTYSYTVEDDPVVYPVAAGSLSFTVTKSPTHGFKGKKAYCGGLRFSE